MVGFHNDALQALFSSVAERAITQSRIPLHSPGSAAQKTVDGKSYVYWRVYLASGKHKETSLGRTGKAATVTALENKLLEREEMRTLAADLQVLRKANFAVADNSSILTLATLFNAGVFSHGGMLLGSHAFGGLLNSLGVRSRAKCRSGTEIISLAFPQTGSLLDILRSSGIPLNDEPGLDSSRSAISLKVRGKFREVDLLMPGTETCETRTLPGLQARATGLPYFHYLVSSPASGFILGKAHVVPVTLPGPARFALHKLIMSALREPSRKQTAENDLQQAAVLIDALTERFPDWLVSAANSLEEHASLRVASAATHTLKLVPELSQRARDFLSDLGGRA
ncbi:GSU2403 family nucleotidyltransferase fold protein [Paraburkholderia caribensis]|uniref:GSU2403 family nucleotidyltransferase fold protein n=1 Tax=Paraburkholderia caribensis TaxID=75105 RepID=UPI00158FD90F|nr:GSU2403 family nucleotidyltransferase fold protein [Paraburkholderia caribensis]